MKRDSLDERPRAGEGLRPDDYLARVRQHLRGLAEREQADLLDEIASHIESGQADPRVGAERVMAELGTPEQMGRGLRGVHRPNRLADLLLALVPTYLLSPLVTLVISRFYGLMAEGSISAPQFYLGGRINLLLAVTLAWVGRLRRSAELTVFWLSAGLGTLLSLMTREGRFFPREVHYLPGRGSIAGSTLESLALYGVLAGLCAWLIHTLRRRSFDRPLVVFAALPLLLAAANYSTGQILLAGGATSRIGQALPFGLAGVAAYQAIWAGGAALFLLPTRRDPRWLGLLLMALYYASPNLNAYRANAGILVIWSALVALVLLAWAWDWKRRGGSEKGQALRPPVFRG